MNDKHELVPTSSEDELETTPDEEPIVAEPLQGPVTVGEIVDGAREVLGEVSTSARRLIDRGRYRKVRITRKGKQIVPDIPLAAAAAIEAASIYSAGLARVVAANVASNLLFDVEIVNEADKYLEIGKGAVLDGNLDEALRALEKAVRIDDTHQEAYLQLGVVYKLKANPDKARMYLEIAHSIDDTTEMGQRAAELLKSLDREA